MQAQKDLGRSGYAHAALIAAARKTQQWTQAVQALAQTLGFHFVFSLSLSLSLSLSFPLYI